MPNRRKPTDEPAPKPRVTPTERRRQILAAARSQFRSRGYEATTHESIAESAGVKLASVQKHFPAKTDLFAGLYEEFHTAAFTPLEDGPSPDAISFWLGLPARFDKVARSYRDVVGLVVEGLAENRDEDLVAAIGTGLGRTADALVDLIRTGQGAGVVRRAVDPSRAAWEWVRWLFGGLLLKPTDAKPAADDELPPQPADILLHGLLKTDV
jgi:AcrR family transcriptional regulator